MNQHFELDTKPLSVSVAETIAWCARQKIVGSVDESEEIKRRRNFVVMIAVTAMLFLNGAPYPRTAYRITRYKSQTTNPPIKPQNLKILNS
jgi:hypothetical protein